MMQGRTFESIQKNLGGKTRGKKKALEEK